ncbi:hypothetical protein ACHAXA_003676, partial [Cyclostephanos tholiformis]
MLEYVSKSEHSAAISWTDDGLAFVINQLDVFLEHVVPIFFNQTKFRSLASSTCGDSGDLALKTSGTINTSFGAVSKDSNTFKG